MYEKRFYREWADCDDLKRFEISILESDLSISCDIENIEVATEALRRVREEIEQFIATCESFATSLVPISVPRVAPHTIQKMAAAARAWDVGPMAAVAGVVAEAVGRQLALKAETVIVENGGDIFAKASRKVKFILYAGEDSPFKDKLAFELDATGGIGVCTSSGRIGPSLSFGLADAVVAIAEDTAWADAAATAIANKIRSPEDIDLVVEEEKKRGKLKGLIACCGDRLGVWGELEIVKL